MNMSLIINGQQVSVEADPSTPLLWVIRDHLNLTGTKFGCGMALCGACTVHVNGQPVRSCVTPASSLQDQQITTIEGLSGSTARAVKKAWDDLSVVQCGYCQSGQIMSATALLTDDTQPTDEDIDNFMSGNICRCATYKRIKDAIKTASSSLTTSVSTEKREAQMAEFYNAEESQAHVS